MGMPVSQPMLMLRSVQTYQIAPQGFIACGLKDSNDVLMMCRSTTECMVLFLLRVERRQDRPFSMWQPIWSLWLGPQLLWEWVMMVESFPFNFCSWWAYFSFARLLEFYHLPAAQIFWWVIKEYFGSSIPTDHLECIMRASALADSPVGCFCFKWSWLFSGLL
jgi:hypothetical protein